MDLGIDELNVLGTERKRVEYTGFKLKIVKSVEDRDCGTIYRASGGRCMWRRQKAIGEWRMMEDWIVYRCTGNGKEDGRARRGGIAIDIGFGCREGERRGGK